MKVNIPFREMFRRPMLDGTKTLTSRTKIMGEVGNTFEAFGATFQIRSVQKRMLGVVAHHFWKEEGCQSSDHFIGVWQGIHPRKGYDPEQWVWVHEFKLKEKTTL